VFEIIFTGHYSTLSYLLNKQDLALIRLAKQRAKIKGNADHIEFEELGMDKDEAWHLAKHLNDTIYLKPDKNGYRS